MSSFSASRYREGQAMPEGAKVLDRASLRCYENLNRSRGSAVWIPEGSQLSVPVARRIYGVWPNTLPYEYRLASGRRTKGPATCDGVMMKWQTSSSNLMNPACQRPIDWPMYPTFRSKTMNPGQRRHGRWLSGIGHSSNITTKRPRSRNESGAGKGIRGSLLR